MNDDQKSFLDWVIRFLRLEIAYPDTFDVILLCCKYELNNREVSLTIGSMPANAEISRRDRVVMVDYYVAFNVAAHFRIVFPIEPPAKEYEMVFRIPPSYFEAHPL